MANIVPAGVAFRKGRTYRLRKQTAQATVGQTDWISVPTWAEYMRVTIDLTAVAGTTPIFTPTLLTPSNSGNTHSDDTVSAASVAVTPATDSVVLHLGGAILTSGFTAAGTAVVSVGPGVSGIANDVALGTSGVTSAFLNDVLPDEVGIKCLCDRDDGDETYTYTVDVLFR